MATPPTEVSTTDPEPPPFSWRFTRGNLAAVKAGARSPRVIAELAATLAEWLLGERHDLDTPAMTTAVGAWAKAESVAALLLASLDERGLNDAEGEPRSRALQDWRASERLAAEHRLRLGLDPLSLARLTREKVHLISEAERHRAMDADLVIGMAHHYMLNTLGYGLDAKQGVYRHPSGREVPRDEAIRLHGAGQLDALDPKILDVPDAAGPEVPPTTDGTTGGAA